MNRESSERMKRIYGDDVFLAPRLMEEVSDWVANDLHTIEFMSAGLTGIAGDMPMLVHASTMSPDGQAAMRDCGLEIGGKVMTYRSREDYIDQVESLTASGLQPVFQHVRPPGLFADCEPAVPDEAIRYLNNKTNLTELAGIDSAPRRHILERFDESIVLRLTPPIVLKVATDQPNGGAVDVAVCRKNRHLKRALKRLAGAESVVVEDYVDAASNWSVR